MKLHEEFAVAEPVGTVWKFFEQPESVAACMPGVEHVSVLGPDHVQLRATQNVGPMTATFDARVTVLERVPEELIRFRAAGRSVRGAVGNLRAESTVRLQAGEASGTSVTVDGDLVLAGALGSVGQKIIARQAGKVTAQFAANLQRAIRGEAPAVPTVAAGRGQLAGAASAGAASAGAAFAGAAAGVEFPAYPPGPERWAKAAAVLSAVSVVLNVIVLARQRRRAQ
jgi:uncharacterized protein